VENRGTAVHGATVGFQDTLVERYRLLASYQNLNSQCVNRGNRGFLALFYKLSLVIVIGACIRERFARYCYARVFEAVVLHGIYFR